MNPLHVNTTREDIPLIPIITQQELTDEMRRDLIVDVRELLLKGMIEAAFIKDLLVVAAGDVKWTDGINSGRQRAVLRGWAIKGELLADDRSKPSCGQHDVICGLKGGPARCGACRS